MFTTKRIYEAYAKEDGFRVLVDRLWPRGVSKEKARIDLWLKDLGPSTELRQWFGHDPHKWPEFRKRYQKELAGKEGLLHELRKQETARGKVTLLYAARDQAHNEAIVLKDRLDA
jgi:uncharacterized protein YeaO (DUF488 family)